MTTILIIIAIIFAFPFILALFVKKEYHVERDIIINRPKHEVFDYIKFIRNQDNFSEWNMMDSDMHKEFTGTDGTPGFIYAWKGNSKVGEGEQEIQQVIEGERITMELRFKKPFEATGHAYMSTEAESEHSTRVKWGMFGSTKYPRNIMNLVMNSAVGKSLGESLNNLKKILEN